MPRPMPLVDPVISDTLPVSARAVAISCFITGMFMAAASKVAHDPEWAGISSWRNLEPMPVAAEMPISFRVHTVGLWT